MIFSGKPPFIFWKILLILPIILKTSYNPEPSAQDYILLVCGLYTNPNTGKHLKFLPYAPLTPPCLQQLYFKSKTTQAKPQASTKPAPIQTESISKRTNRSSTKEATKTKFKDIPA